MAAPTGLSIRWAVRLRQSAALPDFELLFRQALLALSAQDVQLQKRFHFADDALACVLGRLLTRRAFAEVGMAWHDAPARVVRDQRGKPRDTKNELKFNVSHQGDLVVLAATTEVTVADIGVDVMCIDQDREEAAIRIKRLKDCFTDLERATMLSKVGDPERWRSFYRHWCLKEAVLKATGKGISEDLRKLEFNLKEEVEKDSVVYSTEYRQDGVLQTNFVFEESNIGPDHVAAVGKIVEEGYDRGQIDKIDPIFQLVDLPFLLGPSTNECEIEEDQSAEEYDHFQSKPWKP